MQVGVQIVLRNAEIRGFQINTILNEQQTLFNVWILIIGIYTFFMRRSEREIGMGTKGLILNFFKLRVVFRERYMLHYKSSRKEDL
jgi:hypothetical protein